VASLWYVNQNVFGGSHCSQASLLIMLCNLGTPVNTTAMDLKNLLKFLGIEHYGEMMNLFKASFFHQMNDSSARAKMARASQPGRGLFAFLMRSIMMRHSQDQKYSKTETTLMSLPPKVRLVSCSKGYLLYILSASNMLSLSSHRRSGLSR
jgi:hypothetical protein